MGPLCGECGQGSLDALLPWVFLSTHPPFRSHRLGLDGTGDVRAVHNANGRQTTWRLHV